MSQHSIKIKEEKGKTSVYVHFPNGKTAWVEINDIDDNCFKISTSETMLSVETNDYDASIIVKPV